MSDAPKSPDHDASSTDQQRLEAAVRAGVRFSPTATPQVIGRAVANRRWRVYSENPWAEVWPSIVVAAWWYPVAIVVLTLPIVIYTVSYMSIAEVFSGLFPALVIGVCSLAMSMVISAIVGGIAAVPALLLLDLSAWLLRWQPPFDRYGAYAGAITALMVLGWPAGFSLASFLDNGGNLIRSPPDLLGSGLFAAACSLAIFVGQIGGATGGVGVIIARRRALRRTDADSGPLRFRIRHALVLTLLASLALTALRLTGLMHPATLFTLAIWFAMQWLSTGPAIAIARHRVIRQLRRRPPIETRRAARLEAERTLTGFREKNDELLEQERQRHAAAQAAERST